MDEVTQQNAALVERAAAAARSLEEQATRLKEAVAVFRGADTGQSGGRFGIPAGKSSLPVASALVARRTAPATLGATLAAVAGKPSGSGSGNGDSGVGNFLMTKATCTGLSKYQATKEVANAEYETTRTVRVEADGVAHEGQSRILGKNVIVYFNGEIKFALYGSDGPETVARRLLADLCRSHDSRERKPGSRSEDK